MGRFWHIFQKTCQSANVVIITIDTNFTLEKKIKGGDDGGPSSSRGGTYIEGGANILNGETPPRKAII